MRSLIHWTKYTGLNRLFMMSEIVPRRNRSFTRSPSHHLPHPTNHCSPFPSQRVPMRGLQNQKRHASNISEPPEPPEGSLPDNKAPRPPDTHNDETEEKEVPEERDTAEDDQASEPESSREDVEVSEPDSSIQDAKDRVAQYLKEQEEILLELEANDPEVLEAKAKAEREMLEAQAVAGEEARLQVVQDAEDLERQSQEALEEEERQKKAEVEREAAEFQARFIRERDAEHQILMQKTEAEQAITRAQKEFRDAVARRNSIMDQFRANHRTDEFPLKDAWDVYQALVDEGISDGLTVYDILKFVSRTLEQLEKLYNPGTDLDTMHAWAPRMLKVLSGVEPRTVLESQDGNWRLRLVARVKAMAGDLQDATAILHEIQAMHMLYTHTGLNLEVYKSLVQSTYAHYDAIRVLEFLILEWKQIGPHLLGWSSGAFFNSQEMRGRAVRRIAFRILATIPRPHRVLADHDDWEEFPKHRMGELLVEVFGTTDFPEKALPVLAEMKKQNLVASNALQLNLVRALALKSKFEQANALFASIPVERYHHYLSTGLKLYARQGDEVRAREFFNQIAEIPEGVAKGDSQALIYSYTNQGKVDEAVEIFNAFFPEGPDGRRLNDPDPVHYTLIIHGYAERCDWESMNNWLEMMVNDGFKPGVILYTIILRSFAIRGDVDSLATVLSQMRAAGIQPSVVSYTVIITLLANRMDPVGAEAIFKRALADGIVPDRQMISALMNAHVEAGSWEGVIRAFDYLKDHPGTVSLLTIEVYNTLLKAYILLGAPFRIVSKLFRKLEQVNVQPDVFTFSLLIQSACDAKQMRVASDIFWEMDALSAERPELKANVYIMTILLAGFLRTGQKVRAKAVYDEMRERQIQPTAITFSEIIKSYSYERTDESFRIAEEFVKTLADAERDQQTWNKPTNNEKSALDYIYGPLMKAYAHEKRPDDVERLFLARLEKEGEPTLGLLTTLLNAYRNSGNIEAVQQTWPQVFQLGLQYSRVNSLFDGFNDNDPDRERLKSNILCVPLSIYIDALSAAGLHLDVAAIWRKFQATGFTFDSHNWNHLLVALIRAGEPERAFEIIEKVILPYRYQAERIALKRDTHPSSPLQSDVEPPEYPRPRSEAPMHSARLRAFAAHTASRTMGPASILDDPEYADDFAHPLHILHQISPSWNTWKPHIVTMDILLGTLTRLQAGFVLKPIPPYGALGIADERDETTAREIMDRIYSNFPETVRLVLAHQYFEKRRLRGNYTRKYSRTEVE